MSRATVLLIIFVILIVAAFYFLSTQAQEVPTTTIETDVSQGPDAR